MRGAICGMTAPGDPYLAAGLAWKDGEVSHANNGILGEVFNAVMASLAFVTDDIREIVKKAMDMIPKDSEYYSVISFAYDCCLRYEDWEDALRACEEKYHRYNWIHARSSIVFTVQLLHKLIYFSEINGCIYLSKQMILRHHFLQTHKFHLIPIFCVSYHHFLLPDSIIPYFFLSTTKRLKPLLN